MAGVDFGNATLEYTAVAGTGATVLVTTMKGTRALFAVQGAGDVVVASYVNLTGVSTMLRAALRGGTPARLLTLGRRRRK